MPFALILPAAGRSVRFGGPRNKLLEPLAGVPVVARSAAPFLARADCSAVLVPCADAAGLADALPADPRITCCPGGPTRAHSVLQALRRVDPALEWVAVQDAARPLTSPALIDATLAAAHRYGAAVPALAAALTIKQADGPLPAKVQRTLLRHTLWTMQTPQVMRRADLLDAYARCPVPLEHVTDDVQLLELAGHDVWLVPGEERNLKITTAVDVHLADYWLARDAAV